MTEHINDSTKSAAKETDKSESKLNFCSVHESDKSVGAPKDRVEDQLARQIEENERQIAAAILRVAHIAGRALGLEHCEEPEHFQTLKADVLKHAAKNEPAYVEMKKAMC
ncbi:MAG: hypothetical protein K2X81_17255 [Candidatus Obscuribacterales bacterium]|nr:hypothetical protein [Candidatus Obscuribacterales bacterium]